MYSWFNSSQGINILAATYGPQDVTQKVIKQLSWGITTIPAKDYCYGDPFPGLVKCLVVLYQLASGEIKSAACIEESSVCLN